MKFGYSSFILFVCSVIGCKVKFFAANVRGGIGPSWFNQMKGKKAKREKSVPMRHLDFPFSLLTDS